MIDDQAAIINELREELGRVRYDNAELREENAKLREENAKLGRTLRVANYENAELQSTINRQMRKIQERRGY